MLPWPRIRTESLEIGTMSWTFSLVKIASIAVSLMVVDSLSPSPPPLSLLGGSTSSADIMCMECPPSEIQKISVFVELLGKTANSCTFMALSKQCVWFPLYLLLVASESNSLFWRLNTCNNPAESRTKNLSLERGRIETTFTTFFTSTAPCELWWSSELHEEKKEK